MVEEVREVLKTNSPKAIRDIYFRIFNKKLSGTCGNCIADAILHLGIWINEEENKVIPINIFTGKTFQDCVNQTKSFPESINIITNCFFDETISEVRRIWKYKAFCLSNWKLTDGFIELDTGISAWVFKGVPRLKREIDYDISDNRIIKELNHVVTNPAFSIHAIGEKSGLNTLPPYRL